MHELVEQVNIFIATSIIDTTYTCNTYYLKNTEDYKVGTVIIFTYVRGN